MTQFDGSIDVADALRPGPGACGATAKDHRIRVSIASTVTQSDA